MLMNIDLINQLTENSNRIVITQNTGFNPKRKVENVVLADLRGIEIVSRFSSEIEVDTLSRTDPGWMTAPEVYVNFLNKKQLLFSFGVLLGHWIRSNSWDGDYAIQNVDWFHDWLVKNGVHFFEKDT